MKHWLTLWKLGYEKSCMKFCRNVLMLVPEIEPSTEEAKACWALIEEIDPLMRVILRAYPLPKELQADGNQLLPNTVKHLSRLIQQAEK